MPVRLGLASVEYSFSNNEQLFNFAYYLNDPS